MLVLPAESKSTERSRWKNELSVYIQNRTRKEELNGAKPSKKDRTDRNTDAPGLPLASTKGLLHLIPHEFQPPEPRVLTDN